MKLEKDLEITTQNTYKHHRIIVFQGVCCVLLQAFFGRSCYTTSPGSCSLKAFPSRGTGGLVEKIAMFEFNKLEFLGVFFGSIVVFNCFWGKLFDINSDLSY